LVELENSNDRLTSATGITTFDCGPFKKLLDGVGICLLLVVEVVGAGVVKNELIIDIVAAVLSRRKELSTGCRTSFGLLLGGERPRPDLSAGE
jgi:hypothetical protein